MSRYTKSERIQRLYEENKQLKKRIAELETKLRLKR